MSRYQGVIHRAPAFAIGHPVQVSGAFVPCTHPSSCPKNNFILLSMHGHCMQHRRGVHHQRLPTLPPPGRRRAEAEEEEEEDDEDEGGGLVAKNRFALS
jgi:hypothetical protein